MSEFLANDFSDIGRRLREIHEEIIPYCAACESGGWECYGIGRNDPHFRVCQECGNPEGLPSP